MGILHTSCPWILTASPLYYTRKMRLAHVQTALSSVSRVEPTSCWLTPKLSCASVSHRDRRHAPKKKARVLRTIRRQWKTNQCTRLRNGYFLQRFFFFFFFLQNYWMLSFNQIQMRKMSRGLSVTNELLESPCACCLLVLNMKLWRDFNPFRKLLLPTSPPLPPTPTPQSKNNFLGPLPFTMLPKYQGDTSECHCQRFCYLLLVQGNTLHIFFF